jgi:hypothetical protein
VDGEMVSFSLNGTPVCTGGSCPTTKNGGIATLANVSLGSLAPGSYPIVATFTTDGTYGSSTGSGTLTVSKASTAIAVTQPVSGTYGGTVTLIAKLTSSGTGVDGEVVSFSLNGTAVCTGGSCPTTKNGGTATLPNVSLGSLAAGSYPIVATFGGDANYGPSTDNGSVAVSTVHTAVHVDAKTVSSQAGTKVLLTASVYPDTAIDAPPVPIVNLGSVAFSVSGGCTNTLNPITVTSTGAASVLCTLRSPISPGTITANYTGAAGSFVASSGTAQMTVVASGGKDSNLTVSPAHDSTSGGPVTLSATLTNIANAGVKNKTITFSIGGTAVCGGSGPACPKTNNSGVATLTVTLPAKSSNTYPIVANWAGDGSTNPSSGTAELTVN